MEHNSYGYYALWCWYIYLDDWVIFGANVGNHYRTMEYMGPMDVYGRYVNVNIVFFRECGFNLCLFPVT